MEFSLFTANVGDQTRLNRIDEFPNLEKLFYPLCAGFDPPITLTNLKELNISNLNLSNADLEAITVSFPNVRQVSLYQASTTDEFLIFFYDDYQN